MCIMYCLRILFLFKETATEDSLFAVQFSTNRRNVQGWHPANVAYYVFNVCILDDFHIERWGDGGGVITAHRAANGPSTIRIFLRTPEVFSGLFCGDQNWLFFTGIHTISIRKRCNQSRYFKPTTSRSSSNKQKVIGLQLIYFLV